MSVLRNIQIGASGLSAAQAALSATSHNVVNASTPGYQRRVSQQVTAQPANAPHGQAGRGAVVLGFRRMGSELVMNQQVISEGDFAEASARESSLATLEPVLDETQLTGPQAAVTAFFDALQRATQDPADPALRRSVATSGANVGKAFARTADAMDRTIDGVELEMDNRIERMNQLSRELAQVNKDIVKNDSPGDLLDQRDRLLKEAGQLVGATASIQDNGTANMLVAGHAVVTESNARTISLTNDKQIAVDVGKGQVIVDAGGELGGLKHGFEVAKGLRQTLDEAATATADALNTAHAAGFDRNGAAGQDLFTYSAADPGSTLAFDDVYEADPDLLAFASDPTAEAGDGGNLATLIAVEEQGVVGGETIADALNSMTHRIANEISTARADAEHGERVLDDLDQIQASLAGVDLDEEAANLMLYQTAYQASAKVVQVNDQLMDTLLELV